MVMRASGPIIRSNRRIGDDLLFLLGTDGDVAFVLRSTSLAANTALTGVLEGTPVTPVAIAANSLIIGNITDGGDIVLAVSKAGTSHMAFMADATSGDALIQATTGQSVDIYIAGAKQIDYAAGAMAFQQATTISTTANGLNLNPATIVGINETSNANMTTGLTINVGAAGNEGFTLKSSSIAHGMTDDTETDSFLTLQRTSSTGGGNFTGWAADTIAILLRGHGTTDNTAKTTSAAGYVEIRSAKKSGATTGDAGVDANLLVIRNNATTRFIFDAEGSAHGDVEWIAFQQHDDLALVRDMESLLVAGETQRQTERRHALEELGVIGKDSWHEERGQFRAMVNFTRLAMLHHGALMQLGERFEALEGKLKMLTAA